MSYTVEKIASNKVKLSFVESAESFDAAVEKAYLKERSKINVPGFRKGKAPRKLIENMYGEGVFYDDAFELVAQPAYEEAIKAENLQVVDRPQVDVQQIGAGQELKYTLEVFVKPDVTLGEYKGVAVEKNVEKVTDEAVEARIQNDVERASTTQDVTDRAVENGDIVNLDYAGSVDGVAFEGGTAQGQSLTIGSGMFIPGFEEQVAGIRAGEERDVHVTFPQQYTPELAGKDATFHVKAHEINRRTAPELIDETARRFGFENLAALRRAILEGAVRQKEAACRESFSDRLIAMAIAGMETEIPEVMVEGQLDGLMQELEQGLHQQGASLDDYLKAAGTTREALRDHAREQARHGVQVELALSEVARRENINITDEELEQEYAQLSKEYQVPMERLREGLPPQRLTHDLRLARARAVIVDSAKALPGQPKN